MNEKAESQILDSQGQRINFGFSGQGAIAMATEQIQNKT
jgi:hypothetical protein